MSDVPGSEVARTCARCRQVKVHLEAVNKPGTVGADGALLQDLYCQDCLSATRGEGEPAGESPL